MAKEASVTPIIRPAPTWVPVETGEPAAVTHSFTFANTYGSIKGSAGGGFDKIVFKALNPVVDILNTNIDTPNCGANYGIRIFDSKDMIELTPINDVVPGTVNLACTNFDN